MLMLTQIYAEAWSQLDPDLADVIVAALPTTRASDEELDPRSGARPGTEA